MKTLNKLKIKQQKSYNICKNWKKLKQKQESYIIFKKRKKIQRKILIQI